jgi:hypothetical protein
MRTIPLALSYVQWYVALVLFVVSSGLLTSGGDVFVKKE